MSIEHACIKLIRKAAHVKLVLQFLQIPFRLMNATHTRTLIDRHVGYVRTVCTIQYVKVHVLEMENEKRESRKILVHSRSSNATNLNLLWPLPAC